MNQDEKYMARAIQLAKLGRGGVRSNPMVGAVIVYNDRIIGEGYHRKYGFAHAEINAIQSVSAEDYPLLKQSTLYVTLEPCSHYGKTPPCCERIIKEGIPRVKVGSLDPFELVSGRGIEMLKKAGIDVTDGILKDRCWNLNNKFMTAHTLKRPFILLKWAQSADGYIDLDRDNRGEQIVISNPISSMLTHKERSEYDAILVGSRTVLKDNPSLTVRNWYGNNPLRIVFDRKGIIPNDSKILCDDGKTIVFTSKAKNNDELKPNVEYIYISPEEDLINKALKELYIRNVSSLMVEGGAELLSHFIDRNLWDVARIEYSSIIIGGGVKAPNVKGDIINVEICGDNRIEKIIRR